MSETNTPEEIRKESFDPNAVGRLKFDKATGKFSYQPQAPAVGSGEVILEATREGFAAQANPCSFPSEDSLYAQGGVFEKDILREKTVLFFGLGSVGSPLAEKFAREGLGRFILNDFDRVELHNLSRHIAGIADLGRLKTDVVEEHILRNNPYAKITKYPVDLTQDTESLERAVSEANLIFCATDSTESRYMLAMAAEKAGKTVIYGWAETRAEGLDVFIQRPGEACYGCLAAAGLIMPEEITDERSARANGTIPAYTSAADAEAIVQIGLPSDIDPLINMMVKLGLTELARGKAESGIENLGEELRSSNYFTWANRRVKRYLSFSPFNEPADGPTILRWYGCSIPRMETCGLCAY